MNGVLGAWAKENMENRYEGSPEERVWYEFIFYWGQVNIYKLHETDNIYVYLICWPSNIVNDCGVNTNKKKVQNIIQP